MKKTFFILLFISTIVASGCAKQEPEKREEKIKPLQVVTSFYPLYEIAHQIGGENIEIKNLVPGGVEPHDYEPTPRDIINMRESNLLIYNGLGFEPWSEKIIPGLEKNGVRTINMSSLFEGSDPHFWIDPVKYMQETEEVEKSLSKLDPAHADSFKTKKEKWISQLKNLDTSYRNNLTNCKQKTFVTNHAAFAHLGKRYGLEMLSISGISPDEEPSPKTMANIIKLVKEKNIKYILTESLVSPKIAETIAESSRAKTLTLNPIESLTEEEMTAGKNYITIMEENLQSLKTALECGE